MTFLSYLGGERPDRRPPSRVYAQVDRIEPGQSERPSEPEHDWPFHGRSIVLFDSIDADWFDARGEAIRTLADPEIADEADWNVSVVAMAADDLPPLPLDPDGQGEAPWLELQFAPAPGPGPTALHYVNLYAPPFEQSLASISPLPHLDDELARKTSMDTVADASIDDVASALSRSGPDAAAVYDVGQGNCVGLLGRLSAHVLRLRGRGGREHENLPASADVVLLQRRADDRALPLGLGPLVVREPVPACLRHDVDRPAAVTAQARASDVPGPALAATTRARLA